MPTLRPQADLSPTSAAFLSSTSTANLATSGSVRRNLFSAHLSRHAVSASRSQSQSQSQSQSSSQGQLNTQTTVQPRTTIARESHHQHQHAHTHNDTQHRHALPQVTTHRRSVSTPSLSPSPSSPFNNVSPENGQPPAFLSAPQHQSPPYPQLHTQQRHILPPSSSHHAVLTEGYDPTISPNRPLSPRSSATLFPNSSIIALNPITGRPVLPHLPTLPCRLRLSDSDDGHGEAGDEELDDARRYVEDEAVAQAYQRGGQGGHTQAAAAMAAAAEAEAEAEAEADEERRDRERIERLLREMMARQRARAKSKGSYIPTAPNGGVSSHSHSHSHSQFQIRGSRRRRRDINNTGNSHDNDNSSSNNSNHLHMHMQRWATPDNETTGHDMEPTGYFDHEHEQHLDDHEDDDNRRLIYGERSRNRGHGDRDPESESEAEREELMGLIMGSLRREVACADEDAWMFGDSSNMGAGLGLGRDEIGVYD